MICFYLKKNPEICNYADDNTLYSANENISQTISDCSSDLETLAKWFYDNYMVLNLDKCHFMILGFEDQTFDSHYENVVIRNIAEEKILGITIDNKLNFKFHIISLCTVAYQKSSAFCKISNYVESYCPLISMFFTRETNYRLNRVHEKALRIISEDYISSSHD